MNFVIGIAAFVCVQILIFLGFAFLIKDSNRGAWKPNKDNTTASHLIDDCTYMHVETPVVEKFIEPEIMIRPLPKN